MTKFEEKIVNEFKKNINSFKLLETKKYPNYDGFFINLEHIKTKAKVLLYKNKEKDIVFSIGFRTPPNDDTGKTHIIEHSVLCGSKKYPIKDPYATILKTSIVNFINAFTYPDKTIYPFSTTNKFEFKKIMDIYLDAVFFPKLKENKNIFLQEGWRIEVDEKNNLSLKGVVYGEMKGVFSNPKSKISRNTFSSLFSDNEYKFESGGDPKAIIELSYEDLLDYYNKYYHPSNSFSYISGNFSFNDLKEYLEKLDEYFNKFDYMDNSFSKLELQKSKPKKELIEDYYFTNDINNSDFIEFLWLGPKYDDYKDKIGLEILNEILFEMSNSKIKEKFFNLNLGDDIDSYYDDELIQAIYGIQISNTNSKNLNKIKNMLYETFNELSKGINYDLKLAAFNKVKFEYLERVSHFNSYGIDIYLDLMKSSLYENKFVFEDIKDLYFLDEIFKDLNSNYLEKLIEKYFINNEFKIISVLKASNDKKYDYLEYESKKIKELKSKLSKEDLLNLKEQTKKVKEFSLQKDKIDDIKKIKLINFRSINNINFENYEIFEKNFENRKFKVYVLNSKNDIFYVNFAFDVENLNEEDYFKVSLLSSYLEEVFSKDLTKEEFFTKVGTYLGDIDFDVLVFNDVKKNNLNQAKTKFVFSLKVMPEYLDKAIEILNDYFLNNLNFLREDLIKTIKQNYSNIKNNLIASGHVFSIYKIMSNTSKYGYVSNLIEGVDYYNWLDNIIKNKLNDEKYINDLLEYITGLYKRIIKSNLDVFIQTKKKENYTKFIDSLKFLKLDYNLMSEDIIKLKLDLNNIVTRNVIPISSQVNYVGLGINIKKSFNLFSEKELEELNLDVKRDYNKLISLLQILKNYLRYGFLWEKIRLEGGAYGIVINANYLTDFVFCSYRDPNYEKTIENYLKIPGYLMKSKKISNYEMKSVIVSSLSNFEKPIQENDKINIYMSRILSNIDEDYFNNIKNLMLSINKKDLIWFGNILGKIFLREKHIAVVGNIKD
jgi:hypothetical protein